MSDENSGVFLPLPLPDRRVFRYEAADDVLELLYRNPHQEFTVTQLRQTTDHGGKSVDNALKILDSLGLIHKHREGRQSLVRINQEHVRKPDDPVLEIPQREFRTPVRKFLEKVEDVEDDNLVGVVLFGSVARGDADRASDIDIQVIVEDDPTRSRRRLQEIRQRVATQKFDGNRYEIQLLVESVDSAKNYGGKLQEIFTEGIVLYSRPQLDDVREVVFDAG